MTAPFTWSPLTHLDQADTEATTSSVPQSLNEQEDWLASLEAADPSEVSVLVSTLPERPSLVARLLRSALPHPRVLRRFPRRTSSGIRPWPKPRRGGVSDPMPFTPMGRIGSVALSRGMSVRGLDTTHRCVDPSFHAVGLSFRVYPLTIGRTLLVGSALSGLGLANRPVRSSRPLLARVRETPSHPLMDLGSTPKCDPRRTAAETATPHEVLRPFDA
jgi:hypothetical protein